MTDIGTLAYITFSPWNIRLLQYYKDIYILLCYSEFIFLI